MKNKQRVLISITTVFAVAVIFFGIYLYRQQQTIKAQDVAQQQVQAQLTQQNQVQEQQKQCDALEIEYRSECFQISQDNQTSIAGAINKICTNMSATAIATCVKNISAAGQPGGEPFIESCTNIRLAESLCPKAYNNVQ